MNDDEKYFLVHRKKGGLISKESDNENVVIDLIKDSPYFLKKDDVLEEVNAEFVVEVLKNYYTEVKENETEYRSLFYFVTGTGIGLLIGFGFHYQSTEISIFVIPFCLSILLFLFNYNRKKRNKIKEIFEKNYYSAFKRKR